MGDMCGNNVLHTIPSPDGKVKAVLFQRDCGATTRASQQLFLLPQGEKLPNKPGNTAVYGAVQVRWKDNTHLNVWYPKAPDNLPEEERVRIFFNLWVFRTVTVTYTK